MMQNSTTHEDSILSYPDYLPRKDIDAKQVVGQMDDRSINENVMSMENEWNVAHYQTFAASLREIVRWMYRRIRHYFL